MDNMYRRLVLLVTLLFGVSVPAAAEEGAPSVWFTIDAIADCADLAYQVRKQSNGSLLFDLVAERGSDSVTPKIRPTNDELRTIFQKIVLYDQEIAMVFRLIKSPCAELEHKVNCRGCTSEPPAYAVVSLGTLDHNKYHERLTRDGVVRAISQFGTYVSGVEEAIAITRSRFLMHADTSRCYHVSYRRAEFRDPLEASVWFYDPPIRGSYVPTQNEIELAKKTHLHSRAVALGVRLFFGDDAFRGPLLKMFREGDAKERRYAAFRLRAYPDDEVVNELSRVADFRQSTDRDTGQIVLAAEQSLHAMGKRQSISMEAASTSDDVSDVSVKKYGIYELDVDMLRSKWSEKSPPRGLTGVIVTVSFAVALLIAFAKSIKWVRPLWKSIKWVRPL
jgi:hypothetical protein